MNKRKQELIEILQEECAEVIQAVSKLKRFGEKATNVADLNTEIGDVLGVLKALIEEDFISSVDVQTAAEYKLVKLEKYMTNKKEG